MRFQYIREYKYMIPRKGCPDSVGKTRIAKWRGNGVNRISDNMVLHIFDNMSTPERMKNDQEQNVKGLVKNRGLLEPTTEIVTSIGVIQGFQM